jgi:hypothetical protein
MAQSEMLRTAIRQHKDTLILGLEKTWKDGQAPRIVAAWEYALDTMIQEARSRKTCSWEVEGIEATGEGDFGGGDITLRRV